MPADGLTWGTELSCDAGLTRGAELARDADLTCGAELIRGMEWSRSAELVRGKALIDEGPPVCLKGHDRLRSVFRD